MNLPSPPFKILLIALSGTLSPAWLPAGVAPEDYPRMDWDVVYQYVYDGTLEPDFGAKAEFERDPEQPPASTATTARFVMILDRAVTDLEMGDLQVNGTQTGNVTSLQEVPESGGLRWEVTVENLSPGDAIYPVLPAYSVISGLCKLHNLTQDGRDQPVWVTETESYFDWIEGASGLSYANPVTLPFADFDGNDRANLLDYVLPGALPQPVLLSGGSVEVTVRNENPRVRTSLEVSTDLVEWTEILDADTDFERQDQGDGTERLVYSGSSAGEQFYGRLLVRNDELDGAPSGELPPVEPPEEEGENVALWKSTSQSSTSGDRVSDLAVDGVTDGSNGAASFNHTNTDTQAWWLVDLGRAYDIAEIQVWNRDRQPQRLTDFYVVVSESAFASTDLTPTLADPDVTAFHIEGTAGYPTTITAPPEGLRGRYVRVQLAGTGILHMAEVVINQVQ